MTGTVIHLVIALIVGIGLGIFYFAGLWLTVQRLPYMRQPMLLAAVSFVGRTGVSLFGFYLVMNGHGERLIVCLLGFLISRGILVRRWRPDRASKRTDK